VQSAGDLGTGPAQLIAAVSQHAHHDQVLLGLDLCQAGSAQGGQRDRVLTGLIGLAAVAGGEHPHLRRQLRRHIEHNLAVVDQAVR
jgi:hypothetical protein